MKLADSLLMEFDQEAQTTKRVLERIPDDKLTWKPHPTSFSLGQLAMHIASGPGQIAAAVSPDTFESPNFTAAGAQEPAGSAGNFLQEHGQRKGRAEENG